MKNSAGTTVQAGTVEETVTRKRVLPAEPIGAQKQPDFWEYVEKIAPGDWSTYRHRLYIYRYKGQDPAGVADFLDKNESGILRLANNEEIQIGAREETEWAIAEIWGGGLFRLICKCGTQRMTETRVSIDAPRKAGPPAPRADGTGPTVTTVSDGTAEVAHHAINTIASQDRDAVNVGVNALRAAAEVVDRFAKPAVENKEDKLTDRLLAVLLERALNPPDPLEVITKVLEMQKSMMPPAAAPAPVATGNALTDRILTKAVDNLLTPAVTGPVVSATAELVRTLPSVAQYAATAIHDWRMGNEAQRDTAAIMAGKGAAQPVQARPSGPPARPSATILPPVYNPPAATPAPTNGGSDVPGAPSFEFIESRVLNIMADSETVDEAAERVCDYLIETDRNVLPQLASLGEHGLLQFFYSRPTLKPATNNPPKLEEFVRAFLKYAGEVMVNGATEPSAKAPPVN